MSDARDELMLDSMGPSANGGIEIKTHAGGPETAAALLLMADAMKDSLNGHNAENYLEMELRASDKKRYVMTLQRQGKITPHQARLNAEAEVAALKAAQPRTISTAAELEAVRFGSAVQTSDESDTVVLRGSGRHFVNQSGAEVDVETLWRYGTRPFTVIFEPQP